MEEIADNLNFEEKIELLESENISDDDKYRIISGFEDDEEKIEIMKELAINELGSAIIIKSFKSDELKIKAMEKFVGKPKYRVAILKSLICSCDEQKMFEYMKKYIKTDRAKMELLLGLSLSQSGSDMLKIQALEECIKDQVCIYHIVESINSESVKVEALEKYVEDKFPIIKGLAYDEYKIELMRKYIKDDKQKAQILATIRDKELLAEVMFEQEKVSCRRFFERNEENVRFIENNIKCFMQVEGVIEDFEEKEQLLSEMYKENSDVYTNIDFRLLDKRYIDLLGKERINQISCYENIQNQILSLSDNELIIFSRCINNYINKAQTDEWEQVSKSILNNLISKDYEELIYKVVDEEDIDIDKLTKILQNKNEFGIKSKQDINNFEQIKQETINKWIQSPHKEDKISAIFEKVFGHDVEYGYSIIEKYGRDIDSLPDSEVKYYVKALKEIEDITDYRILEELYARCKTIMFIDKAFVERELKTEYFKLYKDTLYIPTEENRVGTNVYNAGTDFSMIITSVGAFVGSDNRNNINYKEDWNRPYISTQHFCASYIRNDMLCTAPVQSICYGFSDLSDDSLMASGTDDIFSSENTFTIELEGTNEVYRNPDSQINLTNLYNEMDFRRIQNGKRKQPDYIVVFKENVQCANLEAALKAQADWGQLPIVIIDKDECLESEQRKVGKMLEEYKISKTRQEKNKIGREIKIKICNNRKDNYSFCNDVDIDELVEEYNIPSVKNENSVSISDLEIIDAQINYKERAEMQKAFIDIVNIKNKSKSVDGKEVQIDDR